MKTSLLSRWSSAGAATLSLTVLLMGPAHVVAAAPAAVIPTLPDPAPAAEIPALPELPAAIPALPDAGAAGVEVPAPVEPTPSAPAVAPTVGDPEAAVTAQDTAPPSRDERRALRRAERLAWQTTGTNASLDHISDVIQADRLRDRGITGSGVGVALIDTGVAPVPGLTDVWHGPDLSLDSQTPQLTQNDAYGHGTHLAGIITGDRADSLGIASDSTLVSLKVGAHDGAVDTSQVIAAIDWVVQHRSEHNIRVLVLAYGTDSTQDPQVDPLAHAVQTAWRNGIVVVVAAGNGGTDQPAVANPATDPYVIAVGAADTRGTGRGNDDALAAFSSRGTDARRPDVLAPGAGIVSTSVPGSFIESSFPAAVRPGGLLRGNGTSQAAAVVGAAAALLLQDRPSLTPDQVKAVLRSTADPLRHAGRGEAGMIDLRAAQRDRPSTRPQAHAASLGTGTLEGARGSTHLSAFGTELRGETDILGQPFDSAAWAAAATAGTSWQDGTWNGVQWTGTGWNGWSWNGWSWNDNSWGGWSWNGWSWNGWSWNGWSWNGESFNGWSWNGWSWNGWSWNGWSWNGWSWNGFQWE